MTPHGSPSTYTNHKCRCQACRDAWTAYYLDVRERRAYHGKAGGFVVPHGTDGGYTNYKCRCAPCTAAHREAERGRRKRREARAARLDGCT